MIKERNAMAAVARLAYAIGALSALALGGCAGGGQLSSGEPSALALPKMPDLTAALPQSPSPNETPSGSATELYTRIARGAVGCWFGSEGGMKKDYIYHAEADAPSRGGKAEIVIHVRDPSQPNPRGAKAYKIGITPTGESSATVATENLKLPEDQAAAMTADVDRWARGEQGCKGATTAAGWGAQDANVKAAADASSKAKSASPASAKSKGTSTPAKP